MLSADSNSVRRSAGPPTAKLVRTEPLEAQLLDRLATELLSEQTILELVRLTNQEIEQGRPAVDAPALEAELKKLCKQKDALVDAIADGIDRKLVAGKLRAVQSRIEELEVALYAAASEAADTPEPINEADVMEYVGALRHVLLSSPPDVCKSVLRSFIRAVTVDLPHVSIDFVLPTADNNAATTPDGCLPIDDTRLVV